MSTISIIGSGNMAATIGTRAAKRGHTIELMSRNTAKAQALAARIGTGATDITNPLNADGTGLVTSPGNSVAQQIAAAAPEGTHVVKAFNSIFGGVLAADKPLDALFAGDDAEAKARVAAFLESLDMRPRDAGGLDMTHALEWAGLLLVGVARNGAGFDIALGV